jgi:polysaccharide export outer membrane protein
MLKRRKCSRVNRETRYGILLVIIAFLIQLAVSSPQVSAATTTKNQVDYAIGAGDVLSIKVYDYDELIVKVRVTETGTINFFLIGEVHVGGLGTSAAAKHIETALADGYIVEPQVTIFVEQFKSKKVVVLGPVHNPGLVELNGPITLLELISQVGGLKDNAGQKATIKRQENGAQKNISIDLDRLIRTGDSKQNIQIQGGDTVSIAEGAVCFITGEVNRPGAYPCSGKMSILKLLTQAGGFTDKALESEIEINRTVNGHKQVLNAVNQDTLLLSEDIVVVPANSTKKGSVCYITGQVNKPGAYPCGKKTTVLKMISLAGSFTGIAAESSVEINRVVNGKKQVLEDVDHDTLVQPEDVIIVPESFF